MRPLSGPVLLEREHCAAARHGTRRLGHDVLTSLDAGNANSAVPDSAVLAFATAEGRTLLSHNRRDLLRLHSDRSASHAGIVLCTFDPDFANLAHRIPAAVAAHSDISDQVIRLNRPG